MTKLLISVFLSMTLMIILASKQYSSRYMIPAILLCPLALYLIVFISLRVVNFKYKTFIRNSLCAVFVLYIIFFPLRDAYQTSNWNVKKRMETEKMNTFIEKNFPNAKVLTCFGSSSIEFASAFTLMFSGSQKGYYENILNNKFPNQLFFEPWVKKIHSIKGTDNVKDILNSDGKLLLKIASVGNLNETSLEEIKKELIDTYNFKNPEFVNVFENGNKETIYEVHLK